jgi:hypothetical protein
VGLNVLRARDQQLELGTMRPLEHGRAIHGEVVKLTPRPDVPNLYEAETQFTSPTAGAADDKATDTVAAEPRVEGNGPAQVASDAYRKNWDVIWKRPSKRRALAN